MTLSHVFTHTLIISSFVFIMMLLIEYINVLTHGKWLQLLRRHPGQQYLIAALLGMLPGCLGAYTAVSLYTHRVFTFGAIVTTMIATSGDEAFVMLSLFPDTAILLTLLLGGIGIVGGVTADAVLGQKGSAAFHDYEVHRADSCDCLPKRDFLSNLRQNSFARALLVSLLLLILISYGFFVYDHEPAWISITLSISVLFALFVVLTVPEHFLEEHLWQHVLKKHFLRIFLWIFAALLVIEFLDHLIDLPALSNSSPWLAMLAAALLGIIPESGPHLIFVNLFDQGHISFTVLLVSSIVQDGHGMLPLLSVSRRSFVMVKLFNLAVGLVVGAAILIFTALAI
jgi:hypothetical protein